MGCGQLFAKGHPDLLYVVVSTVMVGRLLGMLSGPLSYIPGGKLGALLVRTDVVDLCCIAIEWGVVFSVVGLDGAR